MAQVPMPTEHHKHFEKLTGKWDATMSMMGMEMKGVEHNSMLAGGLWMKSEFTGEMMGQTFEGIGIYGYDSEKKMYVGFWVDSMSNEWTLSEGEWNGEDGAMVMWAQMPNVQGKKVKTRMVEKMEGDDKRILTFHQTGPDGSEMETMRIIYVRAK